MQNDILETPLDACGCFPDFPSVVFVDRRLGKQTCRNQRMRFGFPPPLPPPPSLSVGFASILRCDMNWGLPFILRTWTCVSEKLCHCYGSINKSRVISCLAYSHEVKFVQDEGRIISFKKALFIILLIFTTNNAQSQSFTCYDCLTNQCPKAVRYRDVSYYLDRPWPAILSS